VKAAWTRYWHEFGLHPLRVAALRVAFFGLLAYDLWIKFMEHAPRYGAGDMNVTQFAWLDAIAPVPTPTVVGAGWLIGGFLAVRAALGVAVRQSVVLLAILYGGIYVWCQADSYQHHYLLALMLAVLACVPDAAWHGRWSAEAPREGQGSSDARHWALRMLYVQLALVYFWTGFTKVDAVWLTGDTMRQLTASPENQLLMAKAASLLGTTRDGIYTFAAWSVMLGELTVSVFFLWRRLWSLALITAPWFHVGVEVIGFDIELFSYYMVAVDLILLAPRRVYQWAEMLGAGTAARLRRVRDRLAGWPAQRPMAIGIGVACAVVTAVVALQVPYLGAVAVAVVAGGLCLLAVLPMGRAVVPWGLAHVVAAVAMWSAAALSEAPYDYYRLWGGDLRKRGEIDRAIEMYQRANALEDGPARLRQLGELYDQKGMAAEARAAFTEAVERDDRAIKRLKTSIYKDPTNAELHYDLVERALSAANNNRTLAAAWRRGGDGAQAEALQRASVQHVRDARAAFTDALRLAPHNDRAGVLQRELEKAEKRGS